MSCQIQINSISGTSPFDIYLCDINLNQCVFIQTETSPSYPIIISLPPTFYGVNQLIVKIIDGNGCETFNYYILPTPTPTPTITPTITPTPSPTPTPSVTST
jgi:hypothetical protein